MDWPSVGLWVQSLVLLWGMQMVQQWEWQKERRLVQTWGLLMATQLARLLAHEWAGPTVTQMV